MNVLIYVDWLLCIHMNRLADRSVQRLIDLGVCQSADILKAREEAARFSTPHFAAKIRDAERLLGVLGDANRIKILLLLSEREMCVCEIESALNLTQPTASHHLNVLEQAGMVERRKKERWAFYSVRPTSTMRLLESLVHK